MNNKIIYIIVVLIAVVAIGAFLSAPPNHRNMQSSPAASESGNSNTEQFAGFSLKDYSGKVVNSSQFHGKPLVINSWASWCPFCGQELPDLVIAQKEFGDKVMIVAIDRGESLDVAKGYTDAQDTTRRLVFLLDPTDSFYQSIGGFSMPETIFVDKNGNIVDHKRGPMDIGEIRERTAKILN